MSTQGTSDRAVPSEKYWNAAPWVTSLGVVLFWIVLGNRYSLWIDEAFSVWVARLPFRGLMQQVLVDEGNLGPYYIALWTWEKVLPGARLLRGLSVVGTVVAIWGIWTFLRRRSDTVIAASAVVVFASNPFVLSWSIQARGYTWAMAASIWALVAAETLIRTHSRRSALALGMLTGLSTATVFPSVFVYVGIFVGVLAVSRGMQTVRALALAGVSALVVFAPFAPAFLNNRDQVGWIPPLTISRLERHLIDFVGGPPTLWIHVTCIVVVGVASLIVKDSRKHLAWFSIAVFNIAGLVAFSSWVQPLYISRYFAAASPFLTLGVVGAAGISHGRVRRIAAAMIAVACVSTTMIWHSNAMPRNENYRRAIALIESAYESGDGIIPEPAWSYPAIEQNWNDFPDDAVVIVGFDQMTEQLYFGDETDAPVPRRMWLVSRERLPQDEKLEETYGTLFTDYLVILERFEYGIPFVYLLGLRGASFG